MDTPVEGKEEFKAVVDIPPCHFISPHDINLFAGIVKSAAASLTIRLLDLRLGAQLMQAESF